ncbi:MAG: hypothetical protein IJF78_12830 [Clostridia bacterium]|nr:hypothetical protein [Clostridia bacterium]
MNENNTFQYTYSAPRNKEIESIRKKYLPQEENKLDLLRRLDSTVNNAGMIESLSAGILGCLGFGTGMCFFLKVLGSSVIPGIPLCLLGTAAMLAAYPIFRTLRNRKKAELSPRILELTEELMNG